MKIPLEQDPANNIYLLEEADIKNNRNDDIEECFEALVSRKSIDIVILCNALVRMLRK